MKRQATHLSTPQAIAKYVLFLILTQLSRPHSKKLKRAKRQIAVSSAQRTQSLKKKLSSFQHQQHVHTGGGGGGDKPVNSGSMDTRETATDDISSTTTTGSEAMITDEGSRTDRYTLLLLMKGIKYWLAININDGYLSLSVCHTLIILIIIIILLFLLVRALLYCLMVYQLILSIRYSNWKR